CSYVNARKRLDEGEARRIFRQLLMGVGHMHGMDIVHRDVKLENILLDEHNNAKVIDFGFSTHVKDRRLNIFCGTPSYMAPEIIKRQEYEGKPVDVWSMGIVLYAMLCGRFPFSGPSYPELYKNISRGVFRCPESLSTTSMELVKSILVTSPTKRCSLRQVCSRRSAGVVWTKDRSLSGVGAGGHGASALEGGGGWGERGGKAGGFYISADPGWDMCKEGVRRMEAFGVDKDEIVRQVISRRHSCLTTTFYLLKRAIETCGQDAKS
ncbi:unnamed protein product, partial [Discosporangium mesarthrocarpum]